MSGAARKVAGAIGSAAGSAAAVVRSAVTWAAGKVLFNTYLRWVVRNSVLYGTVGTMYVMWFIAEYSCRAMVAGIATALAVGSAAIYVATPFVSAAAFVSSPVIGGLRRMGGLLSSVFW